MYHGAYASSGNTAFDAYKAETLRRLEDEQQAFEGFLQRLREAKDKQEFDAFMEDRARAAGPPVGDAPESDRHLILRAARSRAAPHPRERHIDDVRWTSTTAPCLTPTIRPSSMPTCPLKRGLAWIVDMVLIAHCRRS